MNFWIDQTYQRLSQYLTSKTTAILWTYTINTTIIQTTADPVDQPVSMAQIVRHTGSLCYMSTIAWTFIVIIIYNENIFDKMEFLMTIILHGK